MTSSNRVQITSVKETTLGTTPPPPRMRTRRATGESLKYVPTFEESEELRADRMTADPIQTGTQSDGGINFELIYPVPDSPLATDIESAFYNSWTNTPTRDNDGTADSVITDVATTNTEVTHTTGPAFVASQLVRFSGFAVAGNNGVFKCTSWLATKAGPVVWVTSVLVVGFVGTSGDITATATGLVSTTLDFTTLGLAVGQWIKPGGTAAGDKFANVPANNDWARITAIAANELTLDNSPSGWGVDNGSGKTHKVWFGDQIRNGITQIGQTIERGFLGQTTPTYIAQKGLVATQLQMTWEAKKKITGSLTYLGMSATQGTGTLDA